MGPASSNVCSSRLFIRGIKNCYIYILSLNATVTWIIHDECSCCFAFLPIQELIHCEKGHFICRACAHTYVSSSLKDNTPEVYCQSIIAKCDTSYPLSEIKKCVSKKFFMSFETMQREMECPFCKAFGVCKKNEEVLQCRNVKCGIFSCKECKWKDHRPWPCRDRHFVEEKMIVIQWCPGCRIAIYKSDGCDHITCPNCITEFCYRCGRRKREPTHLPINSSLHCTQTRNQVRIISKCPASVSTHQNKQ
ncbi:hypothetical protein BDQ17DRAFT_624881 [Cyathus striatus]|nr:hypothetical protein BDQ17DRAFT_624881 [Cyathus striatus]